MNPQSNENQSAETQPAPDFGEPLIKRIYNAFFGKPRRPDPWSPEDAAAANAPDARKICLRCLQPQPRTPQSWFCPNCGEPDCDNVNKPFLNIFSQGALLRRLVMGKPEKGLRGFFEKFFLVLYTIVLFPYIFMLVSYTSAFELWLLLIPQILYWYWMICKAVGKPICDDIVPPPDLTDAESREPPQPLPPPSPQQRADALALMRVLTFCEIAVAGLVIGFVIVAIFKN